MPAVLKQASGALAEVQVFVCSVNFLLVVVSLPFIHSFIHSFIH